MDARKRYETCPVCGKRTRRSDCLVGQSCGCRTRLDKIEERNVKILISEDKKKSIVDIFYLVLTRGRRNLQRFKKYKFQVAVEKEEKNKELWAKAELQLLAYLRGKEERDISQRNRFNAKVEILKKLKKKDESFHHLCRQLIKWEKTVESLQSHLTGVEERKRAGAEIERIKAAVA